MKQRTYSTGTPVALITYCLLMTAGLTGCQHKVKVVPLPPVQPPATLEKAPVSDDLPLLEMPQMKLPPVPIAAAAAKPKREKKRSPKTTSVAATPTEAPPVQVASVAPSPTPGSAIGALTAEGGSNPQRVQDAKDLLTSIDKRLNALPTQKIEEQKTQISKVRNFWRDATAALNSGDGEGAMTLATKAKLLLDELEK